MRANSGKVAAYAGLVEENGSNETVTDCRFATAKAIRITASGTTISVETILRSTVGVLCPKK